MNIKDLEYKHILVVGRGKEGQATVAFLEKMVPHANVTAVDALDGKDYLEKQREYDIAIKSPGVHASLLKIPYTTATNIFFSLVKGMTIGVTGTKGKSTTASLIAAILKEAGKKVHLVGNIGNPMLSELLSSNTEEDMWVCELSSYQLSDIEYSPHISVFVSLFPEHMNYHGSIEAYYQAKARIVAHATDKEYLVYNADFPGILEVVQETKAKTMPFDELPFEEEKIPLLGKHNRDNVRAAVTVARVLDIPGETVEKAVQLFQPLRHRLQKVGTYKGITFYDDAISTTPESTIAALSSLPQVGTLMLGGQDRGYDFSSLIPVIKQHKIQNIILFPESGAKIRELLEKEQDYRSTIFETDSMSDAVAFAYAHTPKDTICLLSTASPSYTIWKNFEEKGDEFQKWVEELGK